MMILQGRKNPRAAFQVVDQLNNNGPGLAQRSLGLIAKTKRHFLVRRRLCASIKTQCIWPRRKGEGTFCQVIKKTRPHLGCDTRLFAKDARDAKMQEKRVSTSVHVVGGRISAEAACKVSYMSSTSLPPCPRPSYTQFGLVCFLFIPKIWVLSKASILQTLGLNDLSLLTSIVAFNPFPCIAFEAI